MSVTALGVGGLGSIPGLVCLSDRGPHPRIPVYGPTFPVSNLEAKNGGSRRFLVHKPAPSKPLTGHLLQAGVSPEVELAPLPCGQSAEA